MQIDEEKELTFSEFFELVKDGGIYEIETPNGWIEIGDIYNKKNKYCYNIRLKNGQFLECSDDHYIKTTVGWEATKDLDVNNTFVYTRNGIEEVIAKEYIGINDTYDLEVKHEDHSYYTNNIVSHNTGKTAFTRALGQELNMPIFSFDLATMTNKDFSEEWSNMMGWSPCIALFEDIDAIFNGRENVAVKGMENGLTFDGFLNCIDGVENTDGVFVIVTTNNIDTIDPAIGNVVNGDGMSTRPGRIDRAVEFTYLNTEGRIKMAERIMEGLPKEKWEHLLIEEHDDTGAQFQERCCRLALKLFWENKRDII